MKREIINKLRSSNLLSDNEINYIVKELNKNKKYGLVWEDHPEDVELELKDGVFRIEELEDKRIEVNPEGRQNLLLEGDNLHSLMALKEAGIKVDVIYIDPPYNTLNETGFRYNDKRIDSNDNYRHSKWLSFMYKRLELARDLMEDDGVIFVSIDDNEQANLKLLMDQVFGEENFISNMVWHNRNPNIGIISNDSEYIKVYSKNKSNIVPIYKNKEDGNWCGVDINRRYINPDNDNRGVWRAGGHTKTKNQNPYKYSINLKNGEILKYIKNPKYPIYSNDLWRYSPESLNILWKDNRIYWEEKDNKVYGFKVKKFKSEEVSSTTPISIITKDIATTSSGKIDIKKLGFDEDVFSYPKPVKLLKYLISMVVNKNATVLDFFAGSGTTGQAVMELNKEDGGNRRFILCTNNENNICEEVTYERNRRVITGEYAKKKMEPLPNNLSYYRINILNKDSVIFKEKERLDASKNKYMAEWKEEVKTINETEEYAIMKNSNKSVLFIKIGIISKETKENIDLDKVDNIYMMKHLSRDKMFKGVSENKMKLF